MGERLRLLVREFGPVLGVGRRALHRHPIWTDGTAEGRGTGVVVVPGFGGADASTAVLRRWLTGRGYTAVGAGLGLNLGCTADLVHRLERRVADLARATGRPVVLVGHSRGGWIGRLVAVRRPDLVAGVVMMGSPVLDPLDARGVALAVLRVLLGLSRIGVQGVLDHGCLHGTCRAATEAGLAAPLRTPALAVYSRDDGVVGWRSCRDPEAEWVEVHSSHTGMGTDPELYAALAPHLAAWAGGHGVVAETRDRDPAG
ncbi:alpha/beta fold hydrolase [Pseudonocardia sp.]|uniref:alpha/beta fold hydrolase n=1 Tax=Pseudonocardia sp. TaxID=60912 RepID=UPI0025E9EC29|nr:alpha/beta fold hydrolase [Pseudonocardia sp.]